MIKIIDIDSLFDEYISDYVYKNIGKVKPEEIENQMPVLYAEFGDAPQKALDGKTPNEYYKNYTAKELLSALKEHLEKGVPVSDFLIETLTSIDGAEKAVYDELLVDSAEEYTLYLMNALSDMGSNIAGKRYLEFIISDYPESIKELATELLCNDPDAHKESIIECFKDADSITKARFTEILSHASKDDKVFEILINEFIMNPKEIPVYAGYLAKYGDERALPFLMTAIENDKINYADFEELRFAIESLGGEVSKERDFTFDKAYKKIKQAQNKN